MFIRLRLSDISAGSLENAGVVDPEYSMDDHLVSQFIPWISSMQLRLGFCTCHNRFRARTTIQTCKWNVYTYSRSYRDCTSLDALHGARAGVSYRLESLVLLGAMAGSGPRDYGGKRHLALLIAMANTKDRFSTTFDCLRLRRYPNHCL